MPALLTGRISACGSTESTAPHDPALSEGVGLDQQHHPSLAFQTAALRNRRAFCRKLLHCLSQWMLVCGAIIQHHNAFRGLLPATLFNGHLRAPKDRQTTEDITGKPHCSMHRPSTDCPLTV